MELPSIFLNRILAETAKRGASSLHLTAGTLPTVRMDNQLISIEGESIIGVEELEKIIESIISPEEKEKLDREREIVLVKNLAGNFRFRMNIFYQKDMPALSCHYIPNQIKSLDDINAPDFLRNVVDLNSGLFIIAGPFCSGKSTTGAALIEEINQKKKEYIITLEDPIEKFFIGKGSVIEQRQIGRDASDIISGLQHCLDEDVDVVYIGEIKKDFSHALPLIFDLAAGNAMVFLEMNADSATRVMEKILDSLKDLMSSEAARYYLADILTGIYVQKLLPKRGGGMAMAVELMLANAAVKTLIRDGRIYQLQSVIQTSRNEGMLSMGKSVEELLARGEVKPEDVRRG